MGELSSWVRQLPPGVNGLVDVAGLLNDHGYNISWGEDAGRWLVMTGDQALYATDSQAGAEGFLFGLATALVLAKSRGVVLPKSSARHQPVFEPLTPDGRWTGDAAGSP